jgi:perosamine synthetase
MKIPFHKPILPNNLDDIFPDSIRSGWLTTGPMVKKFETQLSDYLQAEHVIAVNSGTAALHLALAAKGFQPRDKFIAPTYTFAATVEVGEYLGLEPILVDCATNSFNIDLDHVETILKKEKNIAAVIPVHFAGQAVDIVRLKTLAEKHGIFVLEDAAHALETVSNAGKVGNTHNAAAFSFYANKNITTGGEGGAVSTNGSSLAEKVRKLSLHGMSKDGWERYKGGGSWAYDVSELGYKYNMTDVAACFGLEQLQHVQSWHVRRVEIVKRYQNGLRNIQGLVLPDQDDQLTHAWQLFIIQLRPAEWQIDRNVLIEKLNKVGIGTSVHYIPVHMHSYYVGKYDWQPKEFPVAQQLSETVISLPLYPALHDREVTYIIDHILQLWEQYSI